MRIDQREAANTLRPHALHPHFTRQAAGSVLVETGGTRVLCTASVTKTPAWLSDGGWVTAEYAMLPGATSPRGRRDAGGRGKEIQRLIGRSLRAAVDLSKLVGPDGPVSIVCDCDVIEADGGTRTASITGGYVALSIAVDRLLREGKLLASPMARQVAAVSVGIVNDEAGGARSPLLDLCYLEDSSAVVDLNVVMSGSSAGPTGLIEVQGTGEHGDFSRDELTAMLDLAEDGIGRLMEMQRRALEEA